MISLIVFQQMLVILILIAIGYILYKKKLISDEGSKNISFLVVNITNPLLTISCAFSDDITITNQDLLQCIGVSAVIYVVLIVTGHFFAFLVCREKAKRKFYTILSAYANVGFIGIPLVSAVLGAEALIYVTIFLVMFNIFFFTHGYITMLSGDEKVPYHVSWKTFINVGTVSGVAALLVFWFRLRFPSVIEDVFTYGGRATTFLAMVVLGVGLAKIPVRSLFGNKSMFLLWLIRYLAFPVAAGIVLKLWLGEGLLSAVMTLLVAMPAASLPLIVASQYEMETDTLSSGIFISTILSIIAVTLASFTI